MIAQFAVLHGIVTRTHRHADIIAHYGSSRLPLRSSRTIDRAVGLAFGLDPSFSPCNRDSARVALTHQHSAPVYDER